ncbi:hypothetical protein QF035_006541 [Streptomyces umbrinus]|uniref:RNA polymerase sigma-70 region 2 domain-containing protein n=1 Tax=Streptomyces umbrinus TaxID=67370 RepID=A0ABU0T2E5_9ACTN|nr:sigma factor [Streptomyces umbrinus]MDQ1028959.1 hypothetical protein [Streptomyces umbrinus]
MDLATEWKLSAGRGEAEAETAEMDFQQFVAARSAPLFRGALVLTGNRETAEDLVQETLERVCRKWRTIVAKDAPDAYVRRIMVNLANDRWRRFRRTVPHQDTGDMAAPGDEYGRMDSRDQLVRALQSLPMRMRTSWCCSLTAWKSSEASFPRSPALHHGSPRREPDDLERFAALRLRTPHTLRRGTGERHEQLRELRRRAHLRRSQHHAQVPSEAGHGHCRYLGRPHRGRRRYRPRLHHRRFGLAGVRSRGRHHRGAGLDDAKG